MTKDFSKGPLGWSLFLGVLIALGCGIYYLQELVPTCVIEYGRRGQEAPRLSLDGREVITFCGREVSFTLPGNPAKASTLLNVGPMRIWNTRSGAEDARFFDDQHELHPVSVAKDGRLYAFGVSKIESQPRSLAHPLSFIALLDIETRQVRQIPVHDRTRSGLDWLVLSPDGELLASLSHEKALRVHETRTGRTLFEAPCRRFVELRNDVVTYLAESDAGVLALYAVKPRDKKTVGRLDDVAARLDELADSAVLSEDGAILLIRRASKDAKNRQRWALWNPHTHKLDAELEVDGEVLNDYSAWQPLIVRCKSEQGIHRELRDLSSGRLLEKISDSTRCWTSPNGRFLAMGFEKESGRIEMRELPSLRKLWSRQLGDVFMMEFTHDSNAFVAMHKNPRELHFLDSLAGEAKSRIPLPPRDRGYPSVIESTEKRSLVIWNGSSQNDPDSVRAKLGRWIPLLKAWSERESESLVVIDCASFAERFRLSLSATLEYAQYCDADGTLATYHRTGSENAIKIWNVNAWKPLHYCIGVPATVGGIAILFRWWRCRRNRSKRSPAPPVNPGIESPTPN